jgi:plasmid stabilization system protein ParE
VSVARIVVEPLAKQDIREARDWYSEKGQVLSELFRDELIAVFDFIAREPLGATISFGQTRLKPMRRFPYHSYPASPYRHNCFSVASRSAAVTRAR